MSGKRSSKAPSNAAADPLESPPRSAPQGNPRIKKGSGDKNSWVSLQAALGNKEEQLVDLREQHDQLINRSRDALQNWEAAMQAKDHVIQQLQFALRAQLSALERQEKINEDVRQRLMHKEMDQEKDYEAREKGEESIQHLSSDLRTTISDLKNQIKPDDWKLDNLSSKPDTVEERIQSLETALHLKESADFRQQERCCKELKSSLLNKEQLLQLADTTFQSIFSRQEASFEVLEYLKKKMEKDKSFVEKSFSDFHDELVDSKSGTLVVQPRSSSKSPKRDSRSCLRSRPLSFSKKTKAKDLFKADDLLPRKGQVLKRIQTLGGKQCSSDVDDDSSHDESPYFWLRGKNGRSSQEDLSPLIGEIEKLEENWRRTEARMRAELSRRVISSINVTNSEEQQQQ